MKSVSITNQQAAPRAGLTGYFSLIGQPGAFPALDGLRAIAILLVLVRHAAKAVADENAGDIGSLPAIWFKNFAFNGWLGVDLFFVLSGCLIASHLLKWQKSPAAQYRFGTYILKRICRTFPLYYAIIFLILLGFIPHYAPAIPDGRFEFVKLSLFLQDYLGTHILVPLWSLAVEEKFYLVAPVLILLIRKAGSTFRVIAMLVSLSLIAVMFRSFMVFALKPETYEVFFWRCRSPFSWDPILFGVMCAYLVFNDRAKRFVQKHDMYMMLSSASFLLCLLCVRSWLETKSWIESSLVIYAASIAFGCLVYTSIVSIRIGTSFLASASLRVISRLSYALYLTHYTVIPAALFLSSRITGTSSGILYVMWFLSLYITLSFFFSVILHFLIEKPFLLLKDRIS